jgi:hypothetical protein
MFFVFQVLMDASPMTPYELYARGFSRTSRHTFWKVHSIVNSTCTRVYYSKHTYSLQWLYWLYTAHVLGCWLFILHVVFTYSIVTLLDKDNKASVKKKKWFSGGARHCTPIVHVLGHWLFFVGGCLQGNLFCTVSRWPPSWYVSVCMCLCVLLNVFYFYFYFYFIEYHTQAYRKRFWRRV